MQHVRDSWLKKLTKIYALFGGILFCVGIYTLFLTDQSNTPNYAGVTVLSIGIAAVQLAYIVILYPLLSKKNIWLATIFAYVLTGLMISSLVETSGQLGYIYRLLLCSLYVSGGLMGVFVPVATCALIWILFMFTAMSLLAPVSVPTPAYFAICVVYSLATAAGWLLFRQYYSTTGQERVLESKLEEEQFKTSTILESITDGVLVVALTNIIQISNESAAQMLGWTKNEIINLDYHSLIKPVSEKSNDNQQETEAITMALQSGEATQQISKLETLNGRQIYVDIVASPVHETVLTKEGKREQRLTAVIAVLRDVDKQKRAEQQRSDFISTASHEMRTPVASIQGYLELALNPKISQLDEKTKGYLDKAHEATRHLGQLFQDLLTVSQTEDGRLSNHPTTIDVNKLLITMCDEFKQRASKKSLTLKCNLQTEATGEKVIVPPMMVTADTERLREVIANLIENAIKYTPSGSITIDGVVKEKEDSVLISVADTGPGIAAEDIPHLFQKFYRVDSSATREIGGTGLGLYISRQIIELFDGKIWVESKLGTGSTFFIELPRTSTHEPPPITQPLTQTPAAQAISEKI